VNGAYCSGCRWLQYACANMFVAYQASLSNMCRKTCAAHLTVSFFDVLHDSLTTREAVVTFLGLQEARSTG
jgi:hypothetical protein